MIFLESSETATVSHEIISRETFLGDKCSLIVDKELDHEMSSRAQEM